MVNKSVNKRKSPELRKEPPVQCACEQGGSVVRMALIAELTGDPLTASTESLKLEPHPAYPGSHRILFRAKPLTDCVASIGCTQAELLF